MQTTDQAHQQMMLALRAQARKQPWLTLSFALIVVTIVVLIFVSIYQGLSLDNFYYALSGGMAGFIATAVGASLILFANAASVRTQDSLLGFAAGMMLAASAFSLILPGIEAAQDILDQRFLAAGIVVLGLGLGTIMMLGLDYFTPHGQASQTLCGEECQRLSGIWLFVFAIALHNLPEGMAIGISFTHGDLKVGLPLTIAIALQDIPEGFAVALALRSAGLSSTKAFLIGAATGLLEPFGAMLGFTMSSSVILAYPLSMGLAAGAMIFVVCHEVIPETQRNGHQAAATTGLMIGFAVMMFLDTALG
ncbi:MAG: ZIP family metal transporter [Gammaproteobacteria bacterium]|jgi:ZIP family zinc transporter|nr:ZIP family metal transporter [Pseudomonas sp.]MDY0413690.1 ZIP family metal transporter [Pseudomonas sp.]NLO55212.1 ZIP family metal transporter [Gammaproteobacteria bacterium]